MFSTLFLYGWHARFILHYHSLLPNIPHQIWNETTPLKYRGQQCRVVAGACHDDNNKNTKDTTISETTTTISTEGEAAATALTGEILDFTTVSLHPEVIPHERWRERQTESETNILPRTQATHVLLGFDFNSQISW